jgi:hypothetical protein
MNVPRDRSLRRAGHRKLSESHDQEERVRCGLCGRWYRVISYSHLVYTHKWESSEAVAEYKARFNTKYVWSRQSRRKQSCSLTEYRHRIGLIWNPMKVIRAVRERAAAGKPMHLVAVLDDGQRRLVSAATVHIGSWGAACRAARIREPFRLRTPASPEMVTAEIQARYRAGKPVYQAAVIDDGGDRLVSGAKKCIGAWTRALELAGIPRSFWKQERLPPIWPKERIVQEILSRIRAGRSVIGRGVPPTLYQAGRKRFGTWRLALEAAGIP